MLVATHHNTEREEEQDTVTSRDGNVKHNKLFTGNYSTII